MQYPLERFDHTQEFSTAAHFALAMPRKRQFVLVKVECLEVLRDAAMVTKVIRVDGIGLAVLLSQKYLNALQPTRSVNKDVLLIPHIFITDLYINRNVQNEIIY